MRGWLRKLGNFLDDMFGMEAYKKNFDREVERRKHIDLYTKVCIKRLQEELYGKL